MKKWMYDCLLETPEVCSSILKNKDSLVSGLVDLYCKKDYKKIVFAASGSSFNIATCARPAIEAYLDTKVEVEYAISYAKYNNKHNEDALVICLSQSGRSTNTLQCVEAAKEAGNDVVALVRNSNSPMEKVCDTFLYGSEQQGQDVFVVAGVPSSTLFLILFALEASQKKGTYPKDKYKARLKEVEKLINDMPKIRENIDAWYDKNKAEFYKMQRVMICGMGPSRGVAQEGALKLEETVGLYSNWYEMEEFLHGPAYEVKKNHGIFIVDMEDKNHDRAVQIFKALPELTDHVFMVTKYKDCGSDKALVIDEDCCPCLLPLVFVQPFQVLASRMCDDTRAQSLTIYNYRFSQLVKTKA